jgi:hypothetical protein
MRSMSDDVEAVVRYGDADFKIIKAGGYVTCAVTRARIPLIALRYWSASLQEAYVDADAALARWRQAKEQGSGF